MFTLKGFDRPPRLRPHRPIDRTGIKPENAELLLDFRNWRGLRGCQARNRNEKANCKERHSRTHRTSPHHTTATMIP